MKRLLLALLLLISLNSCRFFDTLFHGEVVARVDKKVLYKSEIEALIPRDISTEDSLRMSQQYIQSWATKNLILSLAENNLSKEEKKAVQKEMEDYGASLLVFRYEKNYIESNLDTLVTEKERNDYYNNNIQTFTYGEPVVKARVIKISTSSPNYPIIKKLYTTTTIEGLLELEEICYTSAELNTNFNDQWIPLSTVAKEAQIESATLQKDMNRSLFLEYKGERYGYLVAIYETVNQGEITPFEFNTDRIKQTIISKRRQMMFDELETDVYREAISKNKLIIYD